MDQSISQNQQVRPMTEPPVRDSVPPVQQPPQGPSAMPQRISIGREQGPIQISNDDEDDVVGGQAVVQVQTQAEVSRLPSSEQGTTQTVPQEVQPTMEVIRPSAPEIAVPQELTNYVQKAPTQNPFLAPELQNYGVRHTIPQVAVPQNEEGIKQLPLIYEEAVAKEKAFQFKDSMKWLAAKVHFYWKKVNPEVYK
jgi:hypothetical protein